MEWNGFDRNKLGWVRVVDNIGLIMGVLWRCAYRYIDTTSYHDKIV